MDSIKNRIEKIKDNISFDQKKTLLNKLDSEGFKLTNLGHVLLIDVKNPKNGHKKNGDNFLPVGIFRYYFQEIDEGLNCDDHCSSYLALVNLDKKFPEDYHSRIRKISNSV